MKGRKRIILELTGTCFSPKDLAETMGNRLVPKCSRSKAHKKSSTACTASCLGGESDQKFIQTNKSGFKELRIKNIAVQLAGWLPGSRLVPKAQCQACGIPGRKIQHPDSINHHKPMFVSIAVQLPVSRSGKQTLKVDVTMAPHRAPRPAMAPHHGTTPSAKLATMTHLL